MFVCGLLRGLLRECVSVYDPFERKIVIEKVYRWYRDKRKLLLDYKLRVFKKQQLERKSDTTAISGNDSQQEEQRKKQQQTHNEDHHHHTRVKSDDHHRSKDRSRPMMDVEDDEDDDAESKRGFSTSEVDNFNKFNNVASLEQLRSKLKERLRTEQHPIPDAIDYGQRKASYFDPRVERHDVLSSASNDPSIPFYFSDEKKRKVFVHQKLKQFSKRNMERTESVRKSILDAPPPSSSSSPLGTPSSTTPRTPLPFGTTATKQSSFKTTQKQEKKKKKKLADVYAFVERSNKEKDESIDRTWLSHRAKETESHLEELEMNDAVSTWSHNRARMTEEIFRRHESSQFPAQTSIRMQQVIRNQDLIAERSERQGKQMARRKIVNNFLDSSSSEEEEDEARDRRALTQRDSTSPVPQSTSTSSIRPSSTSATRKLKVSKPPTPPLSGKRSTVGSRNTVVETTPIPDIPEITKPLFGHYLDNSKVVMHNVYEHYAHQVAKHNENVARSQKSSRLGAAPPPQQTKAGVQRPTSPKSPATSRPPSRATGNMSSRNGTMGMAATANTMLTTTATTAMSQQLQSQLAQDPKDPVRQPLDEFGYPPSQLYNAQLDECDRIKLALSKKKIHVPARVLEKSIVIPEDKPFSMCKTYLPTPSSGLLDDISTLPVKKGKQRPRSGRSSRTPRSASGSRPNTGRPGSSSNGNSNSNKPPSRASTAR